MKKSIHELSKIAGISVRTLHYYDEIGLLEPSFTQENGYRFYEEKEILKLQQILFFRELEFPLEQIKQIVNAPDFDIETALNDQKKMLQMKKLRIEQLIQTIDNTIILKKGGGDMSDKTLFGSFTKDQMEEYKEEAKKRWGHTDAYKQSVKRTKNWTKSDYKRIEEEGKEITAAIAKLMEEGFESKSVQEQVKKHHRHISIFYDCSYEMYRNLGQMYVDDVRFTAYYEKFRPGLAVFMRDSIAYFCEQHS